jgi:tetratricopeptide (TPR) repeat protein
MSSPGRIAMWDSSIEMFGDHPFLGVGGGNWKIHISKYGVYEQLKFNGKKRFQRPHNDYLSVLTENGVFGLLAFIGFLFLNLFYLIKIVFLIENREERLFYLFLFSGLAGYLVFSFFDFPKERVELNIYLFFILALATAKYQSLKPGTFGSIRTKGFMVNAFPFLLVLGAALFFGIKRMKGEIQTQKAIEALHAQQYDSAIRGIKNSYSWYYQMDPTSTPVLWYKGLANFNKGNKEKALRNFNNALLINPYHSHIYNSIGVLYASEGNFTKAKAYFLQSLKLRPYAAETLINIAKIYNQEEDYNAAYQALRKVSYRNKTDAFKINIVKALDYRIDELADSVPDKKISNYILKLKKSKPNTLKIYKSSRREDHSFSEQFLNQVAIDLIQNDNTLSREQLNELNSFLFREVREK